MSNNKHNKHNTKELKARLQQRSSRGGLAMETERQHEVRDQSHQRDLVATQGWCARWWCWSREIEAGGATGSWVVLVDHEIETNSVDYEIDFRWW